MLYYKNLNIESIAYFSIDGIAKIEEWRDVPCYEKLYKVSNLGRVKSLMYRGRPNEGILRQAVTTKGYLHVGLHKDKKGTHFTVHILVAMAFLNHIQCGLTRVVDHKEQNRKDNRLEMLHIITQRKNTDQKHLKSSSNFTGVYFHKQHKKWYVSIRIKDRKRHLGSYKNEEEAGKVYQDALFNWENNGIEPTEKVFGSIYKGVTYFKERKKWVAKIKINGKLTHIGIYKTEIEAHNAFQEALSNNLGATA